MHHQFRTRAELILYVGQRATSRACRRAMDEGRVELLGGFAPLPPRSQPGWMLRVLSKHGRTWFLAATVNADRPFECDVWEADFIPWENWIGDPKRDVSTIYEGDNRIEYEAKFKEANRASP